ncbi:MAG: hypothetical protein LBD24_02615 [Spirochaetaceae bacterium]|nr:hypothetical protein [Spirochaetaceae bacterium]
MRSKGRVVVRGALHDAYGTVGDGAVRARIRTLMKPAAPEAQKLPAPRPAAGQSAKGRRVGCGAGFMQD